MMRNLPASVRDRLKQHADAANEDFNLTLTRYGLERLLYRLSVSRHAPSFLLKGALLFSLWYNLPHRPTRDADLLAFGSNNIDTLVATFREICAVAVEDGIVFDAAAIRGNEIRKSTGYGGVRINIPGTLAAARIALQIDIAFGDVVTPGPQDVRYPVLLADLPAPQLRAYPKHTVIAEKLHAICLLGMTNTRMKDYFDLDVLLQERDFEPADLRRAIEATFQRRQTALPTHLPAGLSDAFAGEVSKQAQWKAFLKKNRLDPTDFHDLVTRLRSSLYVADVI